VGKTTFVALRTIVLVVKLSANVFGWLRSNNLPFDRVRKKTVEAVLAVSHVEMNARVVASIDVVLVALGRVRALVDCKVLICTVTLHEIQL